MIIAENICKKYGGRDILSGVSMRVRDGEFVSVMGKSGSGKSTLLGILAGNISADSGRVKIDGEDITAADEKKLSSLRRTKLGFVYQSLNLIPTLDARDNILLPLYLNREDVSKKEDELREVCELLEIDGLLSKMPREMSGGERQRVAIAKSLLHSPSVIMLDEPTGSLDSANSDKVMRLLLKINKERGVSIIQVTHNPDAAGVGDRIIKLSDGEVCG